MLDHLKKIKFGNGLIAITYLIISLVLPNVVSYFLWSATYVLVLWIYNRSWEKTVIYGFWPLSVYNVGQLYAFQVISPTELNHPLYPDGRSVYFKFTPLVAFGMAIVLTWLVRWWAYRKTDMQVFFLLGVVAANIFSSIFNGSVMPRWIIFANTILSLSVVVWWWWMKSYFEIQTEKLKNELINYWLLVLKWCLIIGSLLVLGQLAKKSTLGLVVEQTQTIPYFGAGSDEISWWIRPVGISGHANGMAILIMAWLLAWVMMQLRYKKNIFELWLVLPTVAEIILQSRTVLLGFGSLILWWWLFEGKRKFLKGRVFNWNGWQRMVVIVVIALSSVVLVNRGLTTILDTGAGSGWETRAKLVDISWRLVQKNPLWGVGVGNFIPRAFRDDLTGDFKFFPEPVHNGFWLILVEQGVVGFGLTWLFWCWLICSWWKKRKNNRALWWLVVVSWASQLAWFMFQPTTDLLPINVIIAMLLLTDDENAKL